MTDPIQEFPVWRCHDGQVFLQAEDVGRHNAMDKVIGRALLTRQDFSGMVALLSGRISFEMALKTARADLKTKGNETHGSQASHV